MPYLIAYLYDNWPKHEPLRIKADLNLNKSNDSEMLHLKVVP